MVLYVGGVGISRFGTWLSCWSVKTSVVWLVTVFWTDSFQVKDYRKTI